MKQAVVDICVKLLVGCGIVVLLNAYHIGTHAGIFYSSDNWFFVGLFLMILGLTQFVTPSSIRSFATAHPMNNHQRLRQFLADEATWTKSIPGDLNSVVSGVVLIGIAVCLP